MSADATAFERGVAPLLEKLLPEKLSDVLSFKPDPKLQQRIDKLACKSTEEQLALRSISLG